MFSLIKANNKEPLFLHTFFDLEVIFLIVRCVLLQLAFAFYSVNVNQPSKLLRKMAPNVGDIVIYVQKGLL